jgi:hypothetical protein
MALWGYTPVMASTRRKSAAYLDRTGRPTDDPSEAVTGEVAEYDAHGRVHRRTRFFLDRAELPWLPVGEPAFLLWVLAALVLVWVGIAIVLRVL